MYAVNLETDNYPEVAAELESRLIRFNELLPDLSKRGTSRLR